MRRAARHITHVELLGHMRYTPRIRCSSCRLMPPLLHGAMRPGEVFSAVIRFVGSSNIDGGEQGIIWHMLRSAQHSVEALTLRPGVSFLNIGERCNIAGSAKFKRLIKAGDYAQCMEIARKQVEDGAMVIDINVDDGLVDGVKAMRKFCTIAATEPDIAKVPFM